MTAQEVEALESLDPKLKAQLAENIKKIIDSAKTTNKVAGEEDTEFKKAPGEEKDDDKESDAKKGGEVSDKTQGKTGPDKLPAITDMQMKDIESELNKRGIEFTKTSHTKKMDLYKLLEEDQAKK